MSLRQAIALAADREEVPGPVLEEAFEEIVSGAASPAQIAALLVALRVKGETVQEIVSVARALRGKAEPVPGVPEDVVDTCGTGGDGLDTFNISTTGAFVVAGAGFRVAKHGNRAASSSAGSFDVLEALGVCIDRPLADYAEILAEVGIAPFFARTAHPAMRHLAPVRAELGIRTMMNCLGPLLSPVGARYQLVGVYSAELVTPLAGALGELGALRALVVHGSDGMDELTTTGDSHAALFAGGEVRELTVSPEALGLSLGRPEALAGGTAQANADILRSILEGEPGPRREIVLLNAAGALWAAGAVEDLAEGLSAAARSIDTGAARAKLQALVRASQAGAAA